MNSQGVNMDFFQEALLRLKTQLRLERDQEVAEVLGLTKSAFSERKKRGSFPEKEVLALARKSPELGLDLDFIFTGIPATEFGKAVAPAHMQSGKTGREAALLRHWNALPEALQQQVSDITETLANLYLQGGKQ